MNHGCVDVGRPFVRIHDGEAPASGKPQAAVRGLRASAAGWKSRSALRAFQPVRHAIVDRRDGLAFPGDVIVQVLLANTTNAASGAEP